MAKNNKARDIKRAHRRRLDRLSGNQCAHPDCYRLLTAEDGKTLVGKMCHIEAAAPGGTRFNPNMTDDDRRHFNNLVLLCSDHHDVIDNPENEGDYPVELLKRWKKVHEDKRKVVILEKRSLLTQAIDAISSADFEEEEDALDEKALPFKIEGKINYNAIQRNRDLIEEYGPYHAKIEAIYGTLEAEGLSFKKERLLRNVRSLYLRTKRQFIKDFATPGQDAMDIVRKHADDIFEEVEGQLFDWVQDRGSIEEDDWFATLIIMVDAFMRCKILEGPNVEKFI